ncbi:adenosylcobinamide-phosphate synthase [Porphyromonadaceae bacterium NLAE-zl-C104]|nr:adenosylcobinamide-phosphate synthase [Porphyromonadaceae bacterium NLAE-zl-C104]
MHHFFITYQDFLIPLLGGLLLDAFIGDPHRLPHPIRLFGSMIALCDRQFNRGNHRKRNGVLVASGLVLLVFLFLLGLERILTPYPAVLLIINTILFFYAVSNRSLISEAMKVEMLVVKGDIPAARKQLGWIVGRDTSQLTAKQIRTATLETLAENLSDGVIAPLFFYALGGIPLMMAYKMVNTMDSMIGYKNEKYRDFGWFAARILDDSANFIPARLTALLMVLFPPSGRGFRFIRKYAGCHSSPNSGYPESALAGILNCRFGGPNVYHGKLVEKPYIGENDRDLSHADVLRACFINIRVTLLMTLIIILFLFY